MNEDFFHQYKREWEYGTVKEFLTVSEMSTITGVSVRTLHHYDEIGLLKPSGRTEAGYRQYNGDDLQRLQNILFYKELRFPLKSIKELLDSPEFDEDEAIRQQLELLKMERERLDRLIRLAESRSEVLCPGFRRFDGSLMYVKTDKGGYNRPMSFKDFDDTAVEQYREEVRRRWSDTDAYREFEEREKSGKLPKGFKKEFAEIFRRAGELMRDGISPESGEAAATVGELQRYITKNFYSCTDQILLSLGDMYVSDERFMDNIDSVGGDGTAYYVRDAIRHAVGVHADQV